MKRTQKNQGGFALVAVIAIVAVLLAVAGGIVYVTSKNKDNDSTANQASVQAECNREIDDKDFCKFVSSWKLDGEYKMVVKTTGGDSSGSMVMEVDDQGNSSSIFTADSGEEMKYIYFNKATYVYDNDNATWLKYSAGTDESQLMGGQFNSELDFDDSDLPEAERTTYTFVSKEACGNKTCFKYQVKDPQSPSSEQFVWFDDKDYQLYKYVSIEDGSTSEMTIERVNVSISEPSPVTDFSADVPSEAELQEMLNGLGQ